ncbi:MAG TPA: hypothetical protein VN706_00400 [Gemmatimonadaceae bacterium]|nr:hypothetical protein [Gemmatimonadaceae bacterium]
MSRRLMIAPLLLAGACYGYYPVDGPSPVGHEMQLNLTDSGAVALSRQIGPAAQTVSGRVTRDSANTLIVSLESVTLRDGTDTPYKGEHLSVGRPLIASMAERRFSRARTILFTGATIVALVAARQAFQGSGASSGGSGLPNGTGAK